MMMVKGISVTCKPSKRVIDVKVTFHFVYYIFNIFIFFSGLSHCKYKLPVSKKLEGLQHIIFAKCQYSTVINFADGFILYM